MRRSGRTVVSLISRTTAWLRLVSLASSGKNTKMEPTVISFATYPGVEGGKGGVGEEIGAEGTEGGRYEARGGAVRRGAAVQCC